jgi:hypothetical protein
MGENLTPARGSNLRLRKIMLASAGPGVSGSVIPNAEPSTPKPSASTGADVVRVRQPLVLSRRPYGVCCGCPDQAKRWTYRQVTCSMYLY